jgi:excisionase family DNA binding protein
MNTSIDNNDNQNSMMTIPQAMMRLRVGRPCIQKLMDSGQLKFVKMSERIIRISESALKEYIEQAENPKSNSPNDGSKEGHPPN